MKKLFFFIVALMVTFTAFGQAAVDPNAPLQRDPAVKYGKLANGMTYYIMHNEKPAERAEYYLLTNVGAIEETPAQNGLAHFLEHMCLNGTKNFPGKSLIEYLQSIGASFGGNINASTGVEQTMYMLNNIPTYRKGIVDTAILIMHDYAGFVTNDPKEIDAERGVIIEEWRTRNTADWRSYEKQMKYLYKGSKYETCNIIGTVENLQNFPAEELTDFYKTWYRPDMQAVVVVGDIDPEAIYQQLEEVFADIPARENPKAKTIHKIPDNDEPIVGIITDPETSRTSIEMIVKSEPLPKEYRAFGIGLMTDLIQSVIGSMFSERLNDIAMKPDAPFIGAEIGFGRLTNTCDAMFVSAEAKDGCAETAFVAAMTELEKAKRYGFTADEYSRVKNNMLTAYERAANNKESRRNPELIGGIQSDFFRGNPVMDPQYRYEQVKGYLEAIPVEAINQMLPQVLAYDKNVVLLYSAPEKAGLTHPTEASLTELLANAKTAEIENNSAEEIEKDLLDPAKIKAGKVKKSAEGLYGSTVWTLSNGIKVVVRPSDLKKEEVLFSLECKGGHSTVPVEDIASFDRNALMFFNMSGVSKFPETTLSKMLSGNTAAVTPFITELTYGLEGNCAPKDLETLFQLAYLYVNEPRFESEEFEPLKKQLESVVPNIVSQPNYAISKHYISTAYGNNPRRNQIDMDAVAKMDAKVIEKYYKQMFSNLAGGTVLICGNVDLETLKPMVEKYIGSLPAARKANTYVDNNVEVVEGMVEDVFAQTMTTPKSTVVLVYSGDMPYTLENVYSQKAVEYILDLIYTETIREAEGATYGVAAYGDISIFPKQRAQIFIQFDTDPARVDRMVELAKEGVETIAKNGPTAEQFDKAQKNFLKTISEGRVTNRYWHNAMHSFYNNGYDNETNCEAVINALTPEAVQAYAQKLIEQGNFVKVVMNPEQ
ncbi:MAG: insulinase family protein [Bacteroidales bacterium]|nr:insulinase family protein [Bacteroidales bacterium]